MILKYGVFIDLPEDRDLKHTQKSGVAVSRTPCVGVNRGTFTLLYVAGEWLRQGGESLGITCWSNTGSALKNVMLPWLEANQPKKVMIGVRDGIEELQPEFVGRVQARYGREALRKMKTHTEYVVVGENVALATNPLVPLSQFEWHMILRSPELAGCLTRFMASLPLYAEPKAGGRQLALPELNTLEELLDAWRV